MSIASSFKKVIPFIAARYAPRGAHPSYSAIGEDIIISTALADLGAPSKPSYIDIGAHHPVFGNNTYLFYRRGGRGVLVEPNPELCKLLRRKRPGDAIVCAGAGEKDGEAMYYSFPRSTRNTFSKELADEWSRYSGEEPTVGTMPILSLDSIISTYLGSKSPDVLSIDAEGLDAEILSGFSFSKRPKVICVESSSLADLLSSRGYKLVGSTKHNSIFRLSRS